MCPFFALSSWSPCFPSFPCSPVPSVHIFSSVALFSSSPLSPCSPCSPVHLVPLISFFPCSPCSPCSSCLPVPLVPLVFPFTLFLFFPCFPFSPEPLASLFPLFPLFASSFFPPVSLFPLIPLVPLFSMLLCSLVQLFPVPLFLCPSPRDTQFLSISVKLDFGHPCYGQLTAFKKGLSAGLHKTVSRLDVQPIEVTFFSYWFLIDRRLRSISLRRNSC